MWLKADALDTAMMRRSGPTGPLRIGGVREFILAAKPASKIVMVPKRIIFLFLKYIKNHTTGFRQM